jgi:hypothetical protein
MRIVPVTGQRVFVILALIGSVQAGPIAALPTAVIEKLATGSWIQVNVSGKEGYFKANSLKSTVVNGDAWVQLITGGNHYHDGCPYH